MHLRHVRLRDLRRDKKKETSFRTKRSAIEALLRTYPQRRFVLCGDSGERDAELYGGLARDFGPQIEQIAIRCIPDPHQPHSRTQAAAHLAHLDKVRWTLFEDPAELADLITG